MLRSDNKKEAGEGEELKINKIVESFTITLFFSHTASEKNIRGDGGFPIPYTVDHVLVSFEILEFKIKGINE